MKYKKGLVSEIKAEKEFEKKQENLKDKYNINDEDKKIVVVEKSNTYKFTVKMLVLLVKTIATILLLFLAAVGLITLIYPESRESFISVIQQVYYQLSLYLPFLP